MRPPARAVQLLMSMFERRADPFEGTDWNSAHRIVTAILGLSALLSLAFLPLEPVDEQIGGAGWAVAGALIGAGIVGAVVLARSEPTWNDLLVVAYLGVAGIATLNWLAAGGSSAYEDLFVLWMAAGAVQPPRRAIVHLGVLLLALALPLTYEGTSGELIGDMVAESLILVVLGAILITYIFYARRQRLRLQSRAEVARRLARADPQTGLGNRHAFDEALTVAVAEAARDDEPLSIGLVDIDDLRRINDGWDHLEGDRCLRDVALTIERSLRRTDRCFRWGGDEFVVLLPGSDLGAADEVMSRMAANVGATCAAPDGTSITLTWGASALPVGSSAEDALARADVALAERKTEKRR
jgi:diguanylate cyclase (GGDEF)-like protein